LGFRLAFGNGNIYPLAMMVEIRMAESGHSRARIVTAAAKAGFRTMQ
jgi:hypothetical protein